MGLWLRATDILVKTEGIKRLATIIDFGLCMGFVGKKEKYRLRQSNGHDNKLTIFSQMEQKLLLCHLW